MGRELDRKRAAFDSMHRALDQITIDATGRQVGLRGLLRVSTLRHTLPSRLVLWGMRPAAIDWSLELLLLVAGLSSPFEEVAEELPGWGLDTHLGLSEKVDRNVP